jgi:hypothetical protein
MGQETRSCPTDCRPCGARARRALRSGPAGPLLACAAEVGNPSTPLRMNAGGRDGRQDACAPKVNGIRGVPNCTEPPRDCHTRGCVASQPQLVSSGDYRRPASPPEAGRPRNDRWGGVGTGVPTQRNDVASLRSAPQVLIPRITRALPSADGRVARDDMGVEESRRPVRCAQGKLRGRRDPSLRSG